MLPMEIFLSVLLPAIRSAFTAMRTTTASLKLRASTLRVLLPADAVRLVLPQPAGLEVCVGEGALQLAELRSGGEHLRELAAGDRALRDQDQRRQPRRRRVGGRGRRGVPGGGADDPWGAALGGAADREGHSSVLEAPGRVRALELEPHVGAEPLGQPARVEERRPALAEGQRHPSSATPRSEMTGSADAAPRVS